MTEATLTPYWETVGTKVEGQTGRDFLKSIGADWQVAGQPLYTYGVGDQSSTLLSVPGRKAVVRTDNSKVLATVGETYKFIQNDEMADIADALMAVNGDLKWHMGGELNNGRVVFLNAKFPEGLTLEGDDSPIERWLLLRTGHDGLTSLSLGPIAFRQFCSNQTNMAIKGLKTKVVIRHTTNAMPRVAEMRAALGFVNSYFEGFETKARELIAQPFSYKEFVALTEKVIPTTAEDADKAVKAETQRDIMRSIFRNADNLQNLNETKWRAYQAVAQYTDHDRVYRKTKKGNAEDARALAIMGGTAQGIKDRTLDLLTTVAKRDARGHFVKV